MTHSKINFNNVFQMGTDANLANFGNPGNFANFWIYDNGTNQFPLVITPTDNVQMTYGATIMGSLQHTGTLGFYGATPIAKPVITGCRSDGTALANLL